MSEKEKEISKLKAQISKLEAQLEAKKVSSFVKELEYNNQVSRAKVKGYQPEILLNSSGKISEDTIEISFNDILAKVKKEVIACSKRTESKQETASFHQSSRASIDN